MLEPIYRLMSNISVDSGNFDRYVRGLGDQLSNNMVVEVGIFGDRSGGRSVRGRRRVIDYAKVHEYGSRSGSMPKRSFLKVPLESNEFQDSIHQVIYNGINRIINNRLNVRSIAHENWFKGSSLL